MNVPGVQPYPFCSSQATAVKQVQQSGFLEPLAGIEKGFDLTFGKRFPAVGRGAFELHHADGIFPDLAASFQPAKKDFQRIDVVVNVLFA